MNDKWTIGFRATAWIVVLAAVGGFFIVGGVTTGSFLKLVGGVLLLLIGGVVLLVNISIVQYQNKPIDERLTEPLYIELRSFFRETLLPLGFREEQHEDFGVGHYVSYSRGELLVSLSKDVREQHYSFAVASKSDVVEENEASYREPAFDALIDDPAMDNATFKSQIRTTLKEWLTEQNIQ